METKTINEAKQVVLSGIKALNDMDYKTARNYFDDNMSFVGVLGSRQGADDYFKDMEKMKLQYNVKKVVSEGDDVCLLYDLRISGTNIFGCNWYEVKNGKIRSVKAIFDPRPVLEGTEKN